MKPVVLSAAAENDIADIWTFSAANWGSDRAGRYVTDIRDALHALAAGTKQGRPSGIRAGYHKLPVGSHIVYFRNTSRRIEIVRILHSRQDTDRHL